MIIHLKVSLFYILILISSLLFYPRQLNAQTIGASSGSASVLLLRSDLSPRAAALSGAFTGIADDEVAIQYNPAGLVNIKASSLGISYASWFQNVRLSNILLTYKFDYKLGWALSIGHMGMPDIQGKDAQGNPTSKLQVSSAFVHLGIGYRLLPSFYLGLGVKYFNDQLAGFTADGLALDFGGFMDTGLKGLTLGFSLQNLSTQYQYDQVKENLPLILRSGVAYRPPKLKALIVDLDIVKSTDLDWYGVLGAEYTYEHIIAFRIGNRFYSQELIKPALGLGLNLADRYRFDYSFAIHKELGITHRMGFTFRLPPSHIFSEKRKVVFHTPKTELRPPKWVKFRIKQDEIDLNWESVPGMQYNLYVKAVNGETWKKVNTHPLFSNQYRIKRTKVLKKFECAVKSLWNSKESVFSEEVTIELK